MELYYGPTSPYARKVRVVAREAGLADRIEESVAVPADDPPDLLSANPLAKVPALDCGDGTMLFDSPLLCEYLIDVAGAKSLLPAKGAARWDVLRCQALADGIMDAAFSSTMENRRTEEQRSPLWLDRWRRAIVRSLDVLEGDVGQFSAEPDLGLVATACALAYLDLRMQDLGWRTGRPRLAAWYEAFAARPSMQETMYS